VRGNEGIGGALKKKDGKVREEKRNNKCEPKW